MKNKIEIINNFYLAPIEIEKQKDFDFILKEYKAMKSKPLNWRSSSIWILLTLICCSITALLFFNNTDQVIKAESTHPSEAQTNDSSGSTSTIPAIDSTHLEKTEFQVKPELSNTSEKLINNEKLETNDISIELPVITPPEFEVPNKITLNNPKEAELNIPEKNEDSLNKLEIKLEEAYPIDGFENLYSWFEANITYPEEHRKEAIEGTVKVSFMLNKDSSISGIKVSQSLGIAFDNEAIRLIEQMPKWVPAKRNGIPFSKRFILPIGFIIEKR